MEKEVGSQAHKLTLVCFQGEGNIQCGIKALKSLARRSASGLPEGNKKGQPQTCRPSICLMFCRSVEGFFKPFFKPVNIVITSQDVFFLQQHVKEWRGCVDAVDDQFAQ